LPHAENSFAYRIRADSESEPRGSSQAPLTPRRAHPRSAGLWPITVLVAAFFVLYQQLENYLIAPRIMRRPVQLGPGAVLLAGLIGGAALGLIGALMAIPVAAGIKVLLSERLRTRDAADADAATPGDGQTTPPPSQPSMAPPDASKPAARH